MRHVHSRQRLRQRADLVYFDENGVADALRDAVGEARWVGDEKIVTDKLAAVADGRGQMRPAFPVIFGQAVLDGDDRVVADQRSIIVRHAAGIENLALAFQVVFPVCEELGGGAVERQIDILARLEPGALD